MGGTKQGLTPLPWATMIASLLKRNNQLSQAIGPPPSLPPKLCCTTSSSSSFQFQPRTILQVPRTFRQYVFYMPLLIAKPSEKTLVPYYIQCQVCQADKQNKIPRRRSFWTWISDGADKGGWAAVIQATRRARMMDGDHASMSLPGVRWSVANHARRHRSTNPCRGGYPETNRPLAVA